MMEELWTKVLVKVKEYTKYEDLSIWEKAMVELVPPGKQEEFWNLVLDRICSDWHWPPRTILRGNPPLSYKG